MEHYIECPVCEERFHVQVNDPKKQIACVGCSRKFLLSDASKLKAPSPAANKKPANTNRLALPSSPGAKTAPPSEPKWDQSSELETDSVKVAKPGPLTGQGLQKRRRKKRRVVGVLVTVVLLATIIGILAGLLVMQLRDQSIVSGDPEEPPETKLVSSGKPDSQPENLNAAIGTKGVIGSVAGENNPTANTEEKQAKTAERILLEDLPKQSFFYHDRKDVEKCWSMVQPHLLELTVHDAYGSHPAVGTLIDSRGWIVTSYSTVKGASKIDVMASVNKIDKLPDDERLKDIVRGVIKVDPAQDIAILSVNRRFVTTFVDISVTDKNRVLEGEYMIQSAPPSPTNPYARSESKMKICDRLEALSASGQSEVANRTVVGPETTWLVCTDQQKTLPGSPLVRIEGTFEAINVFTHDDLAYYVPIHELKAMVAKALDEPKPLSTLGASDSSGGNSVALSTDHPARNSSVLMNERAKQCQEFKWIPTELEQYETLQSFTQELAKINDYIKKNKDTDSDRANQAKLQVDLIKNSIVRSLKSFGPEKNGAIRQMNKFAIEGLKKKNHFVPFYGSVIELDVSTGKNILELATFDTAVALLPDESQIEDRFNREDKCLAFIQTTSNTTPITYPIGRKKVQATTVGLITRIEDNE